MKNEQCKVRKEIINVNTNNPVFHPVIHMPDCVFQMLLKT